MQAVENTYHRQSRKVLDFLDGLRSTLLERFTVDLENEIVR